MHILLRTAARWFALLGAAVGLLVGVMTVVSVLGRALVSRPIMGDVELTQVGIALCISLCLPWCQLQRGNIIVDFFTVKCSESTNAFLDRMGALILALCFALLAWRTSIGGMSAYTANSGTMILGFPEWIVYAFMVPSFVLTSLIALTQVFVGFDETLGEHA